MNNTVILDSENTKCIFELGDILSKEICCAINSNKEIIILCIGTDRSTGDSLGPLVGEKLSFLHKENVHIYGNLANPVHAKNLKEYLNNITKKFKNPFIIAVDASLGKLNNVGNIIIEKGPLFPGAAMNKNLPAVGNISIKAIVNICGSLEFLVLQNTRLHVVMNLADIISKGIYHSIIKTMGATNLNHIKQISIREK